MAKRYKPDTVKSLGIDMTPSEHVITKVDDPSLIVGEQVIMDPTRRDVDTISRTAYRRHGSVSDPEDAG